MVPLYFPVFLPNQFETEPAASLGKSCSFLWTNPVDYSHMKSCSSAKYGRSIEPRFWRMKPRIGACWWKSLKIARRNFRISWMRLGMAWRQGTWWWSWWWWWWWWWGGGGGGGGGWWGWWGGRRRRRWWWWLNLNHHCFGTLLGEKYTVRVLMANKMPITCWPYRRWCNGMIPLELLGWVWVLDFNASNHESDSSTQNFDGKRLSLHFCWPHHVDHEGARWCPCNW